MLKLIKKISEQQVARFALIGIIATFIHISVAFFSLGFFYTSVFSANLLGFSCAFCFSYYSQSRFVFQKNFSWQNATRFFTVQFSALVAAQIISQALSAYNPHFRVLFVVFLLPLITYLIHQLWTYKENSQ